MKLFLARTSLVIRNNKVVDYNNSEVAYLDDIQDLEFHIYFRWQRS